MIFCSIIRLIEVGKDIGCAICLLPPLPTCIVYSETEKVYVGEEVK